MNDYQKQIFIFSGGALFATICQNVNGREKTDDTARCDSASRQVASERGERFNWSTSRGKGHETGKTHVATRSHVPLSRAYLSRAFLRTRTITHGFHLSSTVQRRRFAPPRHEIIPAQRLFLLSDLRSRPGPCKREQEKAMTSRASSTYDRRISNTLIKVAARQRRRKLNIVNGSDIRARECKCNINCGCDSLGTT